MVISILIGGYGAVVGILLLLRWLLGDGFLPVTIFNNFLPGVFIISLALMLATFVTRRWRLFTLQLPALLGFLILYSEVFLPPPTTGRPPDAPDVLRFTLLTYNIDTRARNYEEQAALLREIDADVVALQEVTPGAVDYFAEALSDIYPFQAMHGDEGFSGMGVLSRYTLSEDEYWTEPPLGGQRVVVALAQDLVLYNSHPVHPFPGTSWDPSYRRAWIDDLLARAAAESGPLVLAGDFNTTDQTSDYERITAVYEDAYRHASSSLGLTFPSNLALARLDYAFTNPFVVATEARVWTSWAGSDHLPVWFEMVITDGTLDDETVSETETALPAPTAEATP